MVDFFSSDGTAKNWVLSFPQRSQEAIVHDLVNPVIITSGRCERTSIVQLKGHQSYNRPDWGSARGQDDPGDCYGTRRNRRA
jgi:hypothetical protein